MEHAFLGDRVRGREAGEEIGTIKIVTVRTRTGAGHWDGQQTKNKLRRYNQGHRMTD